MATASTRCLTPRFVAVAASVLVRQVVVSKPNLLVVCDFIARDAETPLTLPVRYRVVGNPPEAGDIVFVTGDLFFPRGGIGAHVSATSMQVISSTEDGHAKFVKLAPASICVAGVVLSVFDSDLGRMWTLQVSVFNKRTRANAVFDLDCFIPPAPRFNHLKNPVEGRAVLVRGSLVNTTHFNGLLVELESMTPIPGTFHYTFPRRLVNEPDSDLESPVVKKARLTLSETDASGSGKGVDTSDGEGTEL